MQSKLPAILNPFIYSVFHKQDTTFAETRHLNLKMFTVHSLFSIYYLRMYKTRYRVQISPATDGHIPAAIQYPLPFAAQQPTRGQSHQDYIFDIKDK